MADVSKKDDELVKDLYNGLFSSEDIACRYDELAHVYDKVLDIIKYTAPEYISKELASRFKDENLDKKLVLDLGAGSGAIGKKLNELGFASLHALDISNGILDEARKKNYTKISLLAVLPRTLYRVWQRTRTTL